MYNSTIKDWEVYRDINQKMKINTYMTSSSNTLSQKVYGLGRQAVKEAISAEKHGVCNIEMKHH